MRRLVIIVSLFITQSIQAEWIEAEMLGAANTVWINTEQDALYSGGDCAPFMRLRHLQGRKPRSLQERSQQLTPDSTTEGGNGVLKQTAQRLLWIWST